VPQRNLGEEKEKMGWAITFVFLTYHNNGGIGERVYPCCSKVLTSLINRNDKVREKSQILRVKKERRR